MNRPRVAVLGLGEAGAEIARDLVVAGAQVEAYDPGDVATPPEVKRHDDGTVAVRDADLVLAITPSRAAARALAEVADALAHDAVYADLSTSSPELKRQLAATADRAGFRFADVALMAPVPGSGLRTPTLVSGTGADRFAELLRPLGMPALVVGTEAGEAATRKLLRSVVMKGLAQLLIESLDAAEAAGLADETWDDLVRQLGRMDEALARRLVGGTARHAARRLDEMEATVQLLDDLGVDATMTRATATRLRHMVNARRGAPTDAGRR